MTIATTIKRNRKSTGGTRTPASSSLAKTFSNPQLEKSFVSYCQLQSAKGSDAASLESRIRKRLKQEVEFIANPAFQASDSELILGDNLLAKEFYEGGKSSKSANLPNLPPHLKRLCETRLLTPDEERLLFVRMNYLRHRAHLLRAQLDPETSTEWDLVRIHGLLQAANWHRDLIVRSNMRLVMSIVKKFVNSNNAFDDLLSDGAMSLMRAIDKFDYDRGFRFSTYATQVVRRNAYRAVMQKQNDKLRTAVSTHEPGVDVCDEGRKGIDEHRWQQLRSRLAVMLDQLDRREKLIIRARFSLGSHRRVQTLQRLADVLGVSKERVRQIEKRALDKLRGFVEKCPPIESDALADA
ncbi:MAG: sigma-70 family RNA polymerase sigma factor [Pirellulales bacterium]